MPGSTTERKFDRYVPRTLLRRLVAAPDEAVLSPDGTVVFVDLSGFTRLSERLARTGREGAEHLVDTINPCFSVLLADAYAHGGSLLKFGGDALLLWFEGDEHPLRGCASAVAMRRTLRRIGRIQAGGSNIVLRMSVGVHSGQYQEFLVGSSHREYLVSGPGASTVVQMEAAASAGQILVSEQTAQRLPERCLGAACGPGRLLARSPSPRPWMADAAELPPDDDVAMCLSTAVRAHLLAAPAAPEHRTATVAFLQFGRMDTLIGELGAAAAAGALDGLVRVAQDAADRYEVCFLGSDIAADGGKLLFSAGAPRARGDDEERMLLAMRQILDAGTQLPVRIGVNRGYTFTGEVGPPYRRTYTLMGDVVNLAARLMAKAPWGAMYTTEGALRCSRTRFATTEVPPFLVKGKIRPVQAHAVGTALRAAPSPASAKRLPLVGRDQEVASLERAITAARSGAGRLIELVGEPGSGKSRLLTEASELAQDMRHLHTTCASYTQTIPYATWRDPLRQLLGLHWEDADAVVLEVLRAHLAASDPELLPWLPLLAIALGAEAANTREVEELSPDFRTAKLHEVVLRLLGFALTVPTLLLVEHAHLMDEASAALLDAVGRRLPSSSWLVITTRRDVASGFVPADSSPLHIELDPLSAEAMLALAEATPEAHVIPPHMLALAVQRAAGSPEFLLDLLSAAAGGSETLPDTVETAASARIDALDPGDRELIRRAAVLGLAFRPERLQHVVGAGSADVGAETWKRLSSVFALDPDGHVRFKRPALSEAAYDALPFRLRRELHAEVGRALERDLGREADADPAVLSLHFARAGDNERAWRYAMMGAERATARFAHADAARLYRTAIEAGRAEGSAGAELAGAWESLGEALRLTGQPKAALEALSSARRLLAGDPIAEARVCYHQADITERHGRLTAAGRWLRRGLRLLDGVDGEDAGVWRARIVADLGGIRMAQSRVPEAIKLSRQAIAEAESIGELRALARACYLLDWALIDSGQRDEAVHSRRSIEIYSQLGDPEREARVTINLGAIAYEEGRWDDAIELYRRGAELSVRAGNLDVAATGELNTGEILSDQGRLEEAAVALSRAQRVYNSIGQMHGSAFATMLLGRLAVRDERCAEGRALLEQAAGELERLSLDIYVGVARAYLAEAEAFGGDARDALELTDRLLAAEDRNRALVRRVRAIALIRLGRHEAAIDELEASVKDADGHGTDYDAAAALDLLDALGVLADGADERDAILGRLRVQALPRPPLAPERPGTSREPASAVS